VEKFDIKIVQPNDLALHELIEDLDAELLRLYPAEGIFGVDFTSLKVREMTFCVAYVNKYAVGCGGLRPLEKDTAELKRFYVKKNFRGRGVASAILKFLEAQAEAAGIAVIKLETGPKQPEAIGLYQKFGYEKTEAYGEYIGSEYSYCMGKVLQT
jgi:putative acetyltransferase